VQSGSIRGHEIQCRSNTVLKYRREVPGFLHGAQMCKIKGPEIEMQNSPEVQCYNIRGPETQCWSQGP
jgi:hypothetical protein